MCVLNCVQLLYNTAQTEQFWLSSLLFSWQLSPNRYCLLDGSRADAEDINVSPSYHGRRPLYESWVGRMLTGHFGPRSTLEPHHYGPIHNDTGLQKAACISAADFYALNRRLRSYATKRKNRVVLLTTYCITARGLHLQRRENRALIIGCRLHLYRYVFICMHNTCMLNNSRHTAWKFRRLLSGGD